MNLSFIDPLLQDTFSTTHAGSTTSTTAIKSLLGFGMQHLVSLAVGRVMGKSCGVPRLVVGPVPYLYWQFFTSNTCCGLVT